MSEEDTTPKDAATEKPVNKTDKWLHQGADPFDRWRLGSRKIRITLDIIEKSYSKYQEGF